MLAQQGSNPRLLRPNDDGVCANVDEYRLVKFTTHFPGGSSDWYMCSRDDTNNNLIGEGISGCGYGKVYRQGACKPTLLQQIGTNSCPGGYEPHNGQVIRQGFCQIDLYGFRWYPEVIQVVAVRDSSSPNPACDSPYLSDSVGRINNPASTSSTRVFYCVHRDSRKLRGEDNCGLGRTKVDNENEDNDCVPTFTPNQTDGYVREAFGDLILRQATFSGVSLYVIDKGSDHWQAPAAPTTGGGQSSTCNSSSCAIFRRFDQILNFMALLVVPLSSIVIVIGGIQYATAGGNPEAVKSARARIFNGALALVCFILMWAVLQWLIPGGQLR